MAPGAQEPYTDTAKLNSAIINFITYNCAFSAVTHQNVLHENGLWMFSLRQGQFFYLPGSHWFSCTWEQKLWWTTSQWLGNDFWWSKWKWFPFEEVPDTMLIHCFKPVFILCLPKVLYFHLEVWTALGDCCWHVCGRAARWIMKAAAKNILFILTGVTYWCYVVE